ncbi:hypothetical protein [Streptomyces sp. NBC_00620]|uniref:hypothetical protein n=1 Tax=Streptomyces sp. NBC_00620 TaxID=2903666 RepID=UPI002253B887|nr:hypothetical protein [Streptomyces sp. NBC_00620]MCX4978530.1 hypothetical protein [Streptomyces sp. NBC_00620]
MEETEPTIDTGLDLIYGQHWAIQIKTLKGQRSIEEIATAIQCIGRSVRRDEWHGLGPNAILDVPVLEPSRGWNVVDHAADLEATVSSLDEDPYFNGSHWSLAPWSPENRRDARERLRVLAENLRSASTANERRIAVREFLASLAEMISCLLRYLGRVLMLLLSLLLGSMVRNDVPAWTLDPLNASPQVNPRGPNSSFPVTIHRGGHRSSALGSAVLAA